MEGTDRRRFLLRPNNLHVGPRSFPLDGKQQKRPQPIDGQTSKSGSALSSQESLWDRLEGMKLSPSIQPLHEASGESLVKRAQELIHLGQRRGFLGGNIPLAVMLQAYDKAVGGPVRLWFQGQCAKGPFDAFFVSDPETEHELLAEKFSTIFEDAVQESLGRSFKMLALSSLGTASTPLLTKGKNTVRIKQADASFSNVSKVKIKQTEEKPGGIVIYEGSVENESLPELFHEGSLWHSSGVCKVIFLLKCYLRLGDDGSRLQPDVEVFYGYKTAKGEMFIDGPIRIGAYSDLLRPGMEEYTIVMRPDAIIDGVEAYVETSEPPNLHLDLYYMRHTLFTAMGLDPTATTPCSGYDRKDRGRKDLESWVKTHPTAKYSICLNFPGSKEAQVWTKDMEKSSDEEMSDV